MNKHRTFKCSGRILRLKMLYLFNEGWNQKRSQIYGNLQKSFHYIKRGTITNSYYNYKRICLLNTSYKMNAQIINYQLVKIADVLLQEEQWVLKGWILQWMINYSSSTTNRKIEDTIKKPTLALYILQKLFWLDERTYFMFIQHILWKKNIMEQ